MQFTGSSGTSPYTFSSTGSIPPGVSLSSGGSLTGTPTTAGSYSFSITVTDNASNSNSTNFNVTVNPAPTLPSTTTYYHTAGNTQNIPLAATGGTPSLSYTPGSLPTGASYSAGSLSINSQVASNFSFSLQVTDANGASASQIYSFVVAPALSLPTHTLPDAVVSQSYSQSLPVSGGRAPLTFSATSNSFSGLGITVTSSGVVQGTGTAPTFVSLPISVQVTDANGATASQTYLLRLMSNIVVSPSSLPPATLGRSYSATLSASGGISSDYLFAIASGTPPPGLSLAIQPYLASTTFSGVPTTAGSYSFVVNATDIINQTRPTTVSMTVNPAPSIDGSGTITASAPNTPVSRQFTVTGGTSPFIWSATGSFVTGTSFNGGTATYSGTPTASGTSSFTVTVTDANGATATLAVTHNVYSALTLSHNLPANLTQTQVVNGAFLASGGSPTKTFSLDSGALPPGLALNPNTGAITGSPTTPGNYNATLRVTDSLTSTATTAWAVVVYTTPSLSQISLSSAPGQQVNTGLLPSGGAQPYQIALTAGTLPAGISINGTALTGSPTTAGVYSFTLQLTDNNGVTATRSYTWNVAPTLQLQSLAIPTNTSVGMPMNFPIVTTGGLAPITLSVQGQVPTGLSFDAGSALLSGAPTQTGTFSFTIRAEDSIQQVATRTYIVNVGNKPGISGTLPAATAGSPYSANLSITAPGTLENATATSPLPPGINFSYSGLTATLSGTPTTPGQYLVDIVVEDKAGQTASAVFPLDIRFPLSIASGQSLPVFSTGASFAWTPQSQGGVAPIRWTISQGSLPAGLSLDPASGLISGSPTVNGVYAFTLSASDRNGSTAILALSGEVAAGLKWSSTMWTSQQAFKGTSLSLPLSVEGGTPPYTIKVQSGALPTGLAILEGALQGSPSAAGVYTFTLLAQDSANRSASLNASLTISGGLTVNPGGVKLYTLQETGKLTILAQPAGTLVELTPNSNLIKLSATKVQVPAVVTVSAMAPDLETASLSSRIEVRIAQTGEVVQVPFTFEPRRPQATGFRSSVSRAPGHSFSVFVHPGAQQETYTLSLEGPGAASYQIAPATGTGTLDQPFHASIEALTPNGASGLETTLVIRSSGSLEEARHTLLGLDPAKIRLSTDRLALKPGASFIATASNGEAAYATIQSANFFKLDAPQGTLKPSSRISLLPQAGDDQATTGQVTFYTADGNPAAQLEVVRTAPLTQGALEVDINAVHFPAQTDGTETAQFTLSNPSGIEVPYTITRVQPNGEAAPFTFSPSSGTLAPGATQVVTLKLAAPVLALSAFEIPLVVQYGETSAETVLVKKLPAGQPGCQLSDQVTITPLLPYQGQPVAAAAMHLGMHRPTRVAILDACGKPINTGKLTVSDGAKQSLILPNFTGLWMADWSPAFGSQDWTLDYYWTDGTRSAKLRLTGPTLQ